MNIIIFSRNASLYSTDSLLRAGIRRGHFIRVIDHMACDMVIQKGKIQVYYQEELLEDIDAIIPRIGDTATSQGASLIRQFEAQGVVSSLNADALLLSRDKLSCLQLLAAAGIDIPKTVICNNLYNLYTMLDEIESYPKVLKLTSGTHGLGVILSENEQNAISVLEAFQKVRERVLIQEFIKEARGADIRLFMVGGEVVACMHRQAEEGEFRSNLHRGGTARIIVPTDIEIAMAKKSTKVMGLEVAGVDMLRSKSGPMVLEVNASPGLEGIETTTKVDIAAKIMQYVENKVKKARRSK